MAIDADLNAGLITDEEARSGARRSRRRPTSTARWTAPRSSSRATRSRRVIIVVDQPDRRHRRRRPAAPHRLQSRRLHTFSMLTIGDGLVAQIPALLISTAHRHHRHALREREATSAATSPPSSSASRARRSIAGGVILAVGARARACPRSPSCSSAASSSSIGRMRKQLAPRRRPRRRGRRRAPAERGRARATEVAGRARGRPARARDRLRPRAARRRAARAARCSRASASIRRQIAAELGIVIPRRAHPRRRRPRLARVRGQGARLRGRPRPSHRRATGSRWTRATPRRRACRDRRRRSPPSACRPSGSTTAPRAEAEALGYTVVDAESVIVTHLTETIRRHAGELLTRQDVEDAARPAEGAATPPSSRRSCPTGSALGEVQRVLQQPAARGRLDPRPRRDPRGDRRQARIDARHEPADGVRTPGARPSDHRRRTSTRASGCSAITLDPALEQEVATSIAQTPDGEYLAMEPVSRPGDHRRPSRPGGARQPPTECGQSCSAPGACAATCGA